MQPLGQSSSSAVSRGSDVALLLSHGIFLCPDPTILSPSSAHGLVPVTCRKAEGKATGPAQGPATPTQALSEENRPSVHPTLRPSPLQKFCHLPPSRGDSPVALLALGRRSPACPEVPCHRNLKAACWPPPRASKSQVGEGLDVTFHPRGSVARGH